MGLDPRGYRLVGRQDRIPRNLGRFLALDRPETGQAVDRSMADDCT